MAANNGAGAAPEYHAQVMQAIGGLQADVKHAERSRRVIHDKLDAQDSVLDAVSKRLDEVAFTLKVTTDIAVQARDKIVAFEHEFREVQVPVIQSAEAFKIEAEPILNVIKTVRNVIVVLAGLGIFSVGGLVAVAVWAGDLVRAAFISYLGIGG